jgi:hypothetical protein
MMNERQSTANKRGYVILHLNRHTRITILPRARLMSLQKKNCSRRR